MRFIYTKTFVIFFIFLILAVFLIFLHTKGRLEPMQRAFLELPRPIAKTVKIAISPIKNFFSTIYRLKKIVDENQRLSAKIFEQQNDLVQLEQLKKENETLIKELGFVKTGKQKLVPCTVLSKNIFGLTDSVTLDCGKEQGVAEGQAVISQGYLVGKIIHTANNFSTALLAIASDFSIDARVTKNGTEGVVKGSFGSGLFLEQVPQDAQVEKGWLVATAGINDKIPKNLLLGEVGEVVSGPNELLKRVTVISPIKFRNLDFVFTVK
ncbi:MAG: rod shape-determining protein MreC [Candidatus Doudnabacteria bacterium]|nr:rod shape-determining protein MreC [Candidatus Doudnabacteria bacterium]